MGQASAPHQPEDKNMPKCCIAPYQPPLRTLRELIERRAAGTDDGRIPPEEVPEEAAQVRLPGR